MHGSERSGHGYKPPRPIGSTEVVAEVSKTHLPRRGPPSRQVSNISMPKEKSGICGASANLVNAIVGSGIIGLPYAMMQSGIALGVVLLVLVTYLTDKSLRMIVELAYFHPRLKHLNCLTFEDLMSMPFGTKGSNLTLAGMFVLAYGAMVSYLLIIKDTLPVVLGLAHPLEGGSEVTKNLVMTITSLIVMVPLSMQRDMASLAWTSFVSASADGVLVLFVVFFSPTGETISEAGGVGHVLSSNLANSGVFVGLGVMSFALACQHAAFIMSNSLEERTAATWASVTFRSTCIAGLMCILMGVFGFLGYLEDTQGNILNNFDPFTIEANFARAILALTMFFTFPMESFVARQVLIQLLFKGDMDGDSINEDGETVPEHKLFGFIGRRQKWTMVLYVASLLPALVFESLGPVLSITGCVGGSCIAYIAPGLAYLGVNGEDFLAYVSEMLCKRETERSPTAQSRIPDADNVVKPSNDDSFYYATILKSPKPWWWYIGGFPIWCHIASIGSDGMRTRIAELQGPEISGLMHAEDELSIGPRRRDYYMSLFFISFGMVLMVFGLLTNIYIQSSDIQVEA